MKKANGVNDAYLSIKTEMTDLPNNTNDKKGYCEYEPSPYPALSKFFELQSVDARDSFVEFGCGLGRVVFIAALCGYRKVYAIEYNCETFAYLEENYCSFKQKHHMHSEVVLINSKAEEVSILPEMNNFFFYNPFFLIYFARVIKNIEKSYKAYPRKLKIILFRPDKAYMDFLLGHSIFSLIEEVIIDEAKNYRYLIWGVDEDKNYNGSNQI